MHLTPCTSDGADHLANLRRVISARWVVLAITFLLVTGTPPLLDIPLPQTPLLAIVALGAVFNGLMTRRLHQASAITPQELLSQLLFDIAALSALVFFSGGAANPLVSLLLPPVAIAALTLPLGGVITTGLFAMTAYSLLMVVYIPLPMIDAGRATRLHLTGMWLTFAISAVIIGWFVVRMTALIRERDTQLAEAREQALRHERIIALGTLAAGAAHELGTPLATMAVIAGELAHDQSLSPLARQDISTLRQQILTCKEIITGLSRRAGAERLEAIATIPADQWLKKVRQRWHSLRPRAQSTFVILGNTECPDLIADPTLEQAVINLLNNAANAAQNSDSSIDLSLDWNASDMFIEIRDTGPGFPAAILELAGKAALPPHAGGSGIGLMLTRAAVERLNGKLELTNPPKGGAVARLILPIAPKLP